MKPLLALDVDGVIALEDPEVDVDAYSVSAFGKWRRTILVPREAPIVLKELVDLFDCAWVDAWSFTAHAALADVLDLPTAPWPWVGVQFNKIPAIHELARARPWACIDDGTADCASAPEPHDGVLFQTDPRRGIVDVDPVRLRDCALIRQHDAQQARALESRSTSAQGVE